NNIYSKSNFANDMVIQSDNKIIICGTYFGKSGLDIYIARYNSNGTVDASFGNNGIITIDNGVLYEYIRTIAVQKDGKIIVAGDYNYEGTSEEESSKVFLSRFNIDGTPDLSFGNNGKVSYVLMAGNELFKIAIQEDEKIIAVGTGYGDFKDDFYIARFNKNGTLDLTFGDNGKVIDFIGSKDDIALEIALQNDGKIIIAGYFDNIKDKDIFISRYENNGMLDLSFGNKGKIISKIGSGDDLCYSIKIQEDGKLVVAGKFMNEIGNYDIFLSRFNIDGTPDISFGENGITTTAIGSDDDIACTLLIQEDGKIISAGYYKNRTNFDIFLLRYTANGSIDSSFGINGKFVAHIEDGEDEAYAIAFQGNKKIVIFGQYSTSNEYFKAYLIRLLL
ncbi:MAG TPA: hypothetical protein PK449_03760, partial [Exilispira sp.]|nr:hypothetical protein [Exilispira sp.]